MSSEQRRERLGLDHLSSEAFSAALAKLAADHQSAVEEHLRKRQAPPEPMSAFANIVDEEPTRRSQDKKPLPQPVVAKASSSAPPAQPIAKKQPGAAAPKPLVAPSAPVPSTQEVAQVAAKQKEEAISSLTALHLQLAGGARSVGGAGKSGATTRPGSAGITSRSAGQRAASAAGSGDSKASEAFASRMEQFGVMNEISQLMSGLHKLPEPMRLLVMRGLQDAQSAVEVRDIIAQTQPLLG